MRLPRICGAVASLNCNLRLTFEMSSAAAVLRDFASGLLAALACWEDVSLSDPKYSENSNSILASFPWT